MKRDVILIMFLFFLSLILFGSDGIAATIYLKNGQQIQGEIVEQTKDNVTIDRKVNGNIVTVTYSRDEISDITTQKTSSEKPNREKQIELRKETKSRKEFRSIIASKTKKVKSFKADIKVADELSMEQFKSVKGKVLYKRGRGFKMITNIPKIGTRNGPFQAVEIINKERWFDIGPIKGIVNMIRLDRVREKLLKEDYVTRIDRIRLDLWQSRNFLKPLRFEDSIAFKFVDWSEEKLNGEPVYKFVLKRRSKLPDREKPVSLITKIWVDKEYGILRKYIVESNERRLTFFELKNIVINPEIKNSEFQDAIPENNPIVDETYLRLFNIEQLKLKKSKQPSLPRPLNRVNFNTPRGNESAPF